ncbi:endonuclease/exonuclease/phosphatase family protein [Maribacter sp. 2210JD10-5]|uniref:endonuclease/exonuclease/phosphatase family protein n=1 Tax=Maribacter sp. 2210JD10-5 TaxID=3386272 RepID=UPI0039BC9C66
MKKFSLFNKLLLTVNFILVILLLLACIVPYASIASFSFLSLCVPLLVILNILFVAYWCFVKFKMIRFSLFALIVGYFSLGSFYRLSNKIVVSKENGIGIMSFNTAGFGKSKYGKQYKDGKHIIDFIIEQNQDIVCIQEFDGRRRNSSDFDIYPHEYFNGGTNNNVSKVRQAIFSKYPIIDTGVLDFPKSFNQGIYADVIIEKDTLRIYNLHLESLRVRPLSIAHEESDKLFKRLNSSFSKQQQQAEIFKKHAATSPYKYIVCGDFNNTQFSNPYLTIRGDMKDTFEEKGSGYGKTIYFWRFPLRIDFILTDPSFEVLTHQNFDVSLSDHKPIIASIKLGSDK